MQFLPRAHFQQLLDALSDAGYLVYGPVARDGAMVFRPISTVSELPTGLTSLQQPGGYRLHAGGHPRWFDWNTGPQALKPLLFAPEEPLWQVARDEQGVLAFQAVTPPSRPLAVIGLRGCDLAALQLQRRHFAADRHFQRRVEGLFIVALHCRDSAATCFCASTGDGPRAGAGFDLALLELDQGFLLECGSDAGTALATSLELTTATAEQQRQGRELSQHAAAAQQRRIDPARLAERLAPNRQDALWQRLADRCLGCANCTSVCPTCFCHSELDQGDATGDRFTHQRQWSSCFTLEHGYMHGYQLRGDIARQYQQWFYHKHKAWWDQYGRSGCVGCGRCISWCPAAIDICAVAAEVCDEPS